MRTVGRRADLRYTGEVSDASGDYESFRDKDKKERLIAPSTGKEKGAAGAGRGFVNKKTAFAQGGAVASLADMFKAKPKAKPVGKDDAPNMLTGQAAGAAKAIRTRRQRLDDMESEAVHGPKKYAKGGMVCRGYGKARGG